MVLKLFPARRRFNIYPRNNFILCFWGIFLFVYWPLGLIFLFLGFIFLIILIAAVFSQS